MKRLTLSLAAIATLACASIANAVDCPPSDVDATVKLVESKKSCYEAADTARQCAWGSSADVHISGAAIEICARDYTNISQKDLVIYEALMNKCNKKYENEQGTLYRAMNAHCRLNVAELFSKLYSPVQ